jgi:hypothetical protein
MRHYETAELNFKGAPSNMTAAEYLFRLSEARVLELIDEGQFSKGLAEIFRYLAA